ncbi:MAG: D-glycero-beta-D-manno-heptose-7-phosphate kinase [Candidatus Micrarchaeota archaeon]|nr:D-glycero-beta-D-manno-heptose-7-phosphate kinase [Candidatus Micrarchaeota archaeon]
MKELIMNIKEVINAIENFKNKKILVIGDIILDIYSFGKVERISPEAPVQIFEILNEEKRLGGAGNVVNNLLELGINVSICSIVGENEFGFTVKKMLQEKNVETTSLFFTHQDRYSYKNRLISVDYNHQVLRIDRETKEEINQNSEAKIIEFLNQKIKEFDAIIISDYLKGLLTERLLENIIKICDNNNLPLIIDPKGKDYKKYKNATIITPNKKEAEIASGISITDSETLKKAGIKLLNELNLKAILITLGKDGMAFFTKNEIFSIPAKAKEVYDVSGAGDTVIATLAAAIVAGLSWKDAVELSNIAAGIVVAKLGTQPITKEELLSELDTGRANNKKIVNIYELLNYLKKAKDENKKIVFTNGCFDLLHVGHADLLSKAKKLGDILIVGLNSDNSVRRLKGEKRPIINQQQRASLLAALNAVDYVVIFDEDTPIELIKKIKPDILVKGKDYKKEDVVGREIVESYGGKVELIELLEGISTTSIVEKISNNRG